MLSVAFEQLPHPTNKQVPLLFMNCDRSTGSILFTNAPCPKPYVQFRFNPMVVNFFQATGLLGTINNIAVILISIRKGYNAKKKIPDLVSESSSSLNYISEIAPEISQYVELGGIGIKSSRWKLI